MRKPPKNESSRRRSTKGSLNFASPIFDDYDEWCRDQLRQSGWVEATIGIGPRSWLRPDGVTLAEEEAFLQLAAKSRME